MGRHDSNDDGADPGTTHDMAKTDSLVPIERIAGQIYLIRGRKVLLDSDLAALYGVPTKALNQAVTRNSERFPADFMFRLTAQEWNRSQTVTGSQKHRDPRYPPRAFTQEGVAMLSSVLRSQRAEILATNEDLARKVARHAAEPGKPAWWMQDCFASRKLRRSARGWGSWTTTTRGS